MLCVFIVGCFSLDVAWIALIVVCWLLCVGGSLWFVVCLLLFCGCDLSSIIFVCFCLLLCALRDVRCVRFVE